VRSLLTQGSSRSLQVIVMCNRKGSVEVAGEMNLCLSLRCICCLNDDSGGAEGISTNPTPPRGSVDHRTVVGEECLLMVKDY